MSRTLFFALLVSNQLSAQIIIATGNNAIELVEHITTPYSVEVFNVQKNGSDSSHGVFLGSSSLNLNGGILLSTGYSSHFFNTGFGDSGPQGPNNNSSSGISNQYPGFYLLDSMAGIQTYDAYILEFDFIPAGDSIFLNFVFASEEYPEFVDGGFNDVFAVFLSGPGILDTINMALIPGTSTDVSISNINNGTMNAGPCMNCSYYVNNGTGSNSPYNVDDYYIQYDGLTIPIMASQPVICGETYHLIIAIADGGDELYDSGVFIETGSFKSNDFNYFEFRQNGQPITTSFFVDSLNSNADSLLFSFYVKNNSLTDSIFTLRREKIVHPFNWHDKLIMPNASYYLADTLDWISPGSNTFMVDEGDSVLIKAIVYPSSEGCETYRYSLQSNCGVWLNEFEVSYGVGSNDCNLGVENIPANSGSSLKIIPNPAMEEVRLILPNCDSGFKGQLYTVDGRFIQDFHSSQSEFKLPLGNINPGVYLIVITNPITNLIETKRLIIK